MIIIYILIALAAAAVIAFVAGSLRNRSLKKKLTQGEISEMPTVVQPPQESLLAAVSKQIEYYNDEELDRFRGKDASAYSETEIDEFRDILYTMRDYEVAGWVRSLQLRGVPLPDALKDEVFLIIGERRFDHA